MTRTSARAVLEPCDFTAEAPVVADIPEPLAAEWQALAAVAGEPNAFGECWFVAAALRHFRGDETVRLAQVRDGAGALVGVLPLVISPQHGRLPIANTANWIHLQCYCGLPLIRAGDEIPFWTTLLDLLDRSDWASGFLSLRLIYADGPVHCGLAQAAQASGRLLHVAQQYERATLASDADPAAYIETTIRAKKR
jgi:hypothetical protein